MFQIILGNKTTLSENKKIITEINFSKKIFFNLRSTNKIKIIDKIIEALFKIQGGYALTILTNNKLIGIRDPFGIRPLVLGKLNKSYILASETCAFDIIGAKFIREIQNGEIVVITENGIESIKPFPKVKERPCIFEYIYFSRPDSIIKNIRDRKSTRLNSSHVLISYAVFCLKKKKPQRLSTTINILPDPPYSSTHTTVNAATSRT